MSCLSLLQPWHMNWALLNLPLPLLMFCHFNQKWKLPKTTAKVTPQLYTSKFSSPPCKFVAAIVKSFSGSNSSFAMSFDLESFCCRLTNGSRNVITWKGRFTGFLRYLSVLWFDVLAYTWPKLLFDSIWHTKLFWSIFKSINAQNLNISKLYLGPTYMWTLYWLSKGILENKFKTNCVARDEILSKIWDNISKYFNCVADVEIVSKIWTNILSRKYFNGVADIEILSGKSGAARPVREWSPGEPVGPGPAAADAFLVKAETNKAESMFN